MGGTYPGSITIAPSGKFLYATNWISNGLLGFSIDSTTGALIPITGSPFTAGSGPAAITVAPSGKFVYVANDIPMIFRPILSILRAAH